MKNYKEAHFRKWNLNIYKKRGLQVKHFILSQQSFGMDFPQTIWIYHPKTTTK